MILRRVAPAIVVMALAGDAHAQGMTPRWVDRRVTLPKKVAGTIDMGLGIGHYQESPTYSNNGGGLNFDGAIGIMGRVDIGLRAGLRFGQARPNDRNEGSIAQADSYARFYDALAFYPLSAGESVATNPELRVRVKVYDKNWFGFAIEGRSVLPFVNGTVWAQIAGVPLQFHLGRAVRIDVAGWVTLDFTQPTTRATFTFPASFWFQVHDRVWLGPTVGFRAYTADPAYGNADWWDFFLGFGVGVSLARFLDLKMQVFFPRLNDGARWVGTGVGVGFYFR